MGTCRAYGEWSPAHRLACLMGGSIVGILVKPEDAPQAEKWDQDFWGCGVSPRDIPPREVSLGTFLPQGQQEGAEKLSGGQRQPSGNGQNKGCGPASPEGVRVCPGSVARVWAAGARGRGQAPSLDGSQEARGLTDLGTHGGAAGAVTEVDRVPPIQCCSREQAGRSGRAPGPCTCTSPQEKPEIYTSVQNPLISKYWQLIRVENRKPAGIKPVAHRTAFCLRMTTSTL